MSGLPIFLPEAKTEASLILGDSVKLTKLPKNKLSEIIVTKLSPISKEIQKLLSDKNYIDQILGDGAAKAQDISSKKVKKIKEIVGF